MNQLINDFFNKVFILVGPTAVGKSDYAVFLALLYDAEIINCDLMQIFEYGKIGTGQIHKRDMVGVVHHLIGFLRDAESINVYQMRVFIELKIRDIISRGKRVIIVGGSFFCVMSLFFIPFSIYQTMYCKNISSNNCRKNRNFIFDSFVFADTKKKKTTSEDIIFYPLYDYSVLEIDMCDMVKWKNICLKRVKKFIQMGIVSEYLSFPQKWREMFIRKKIIGYYEIEKYLFIKEEKKEKKIGGEDMLNEYTERVFFATCQYGKKQRTFAKKLAKFLLLYGVLYKKYKF